MEGFVFKPPQTEDEWIVLSLACLNLFLVTGAVWSLLTVSRSLWSL